MQTFLPYESFSASAYALDRQRLGKQRVEAWQILRVLTGQTNGWANHPAVKMWRGYDNALAYYGVRICSEWIGRGYKDTLLPKFIEHNSKNILTLPHWLGDEQFHTSHKSNLLRKDPEHYGQYWDNIPDDLPYVWPAELTKVK